MKKIVLLLAAVSLIGFASCSYKDTCWKLALSKDGQNLYTEYFYGDLVMVSARETELLVEQNFGVGTKVETTEVDLSKSDCN